MLQRSAILSLMVAALSACTAQRLVAPPPLSPPAERTALLDTKLVLRSLDVTNATTEDVRRRAKEAFERAFVTSLVNSAYFGAIYDDVNGRAPLADDTIALDVSIRLADDSDRTWVFDVIGMGVFPFAPVWGHANVEIAWTLRSGYDVEGPQKIRVESPYSILFYSWYRTGPIEDAFVRGHERAFQEMTSRLLVQLAKREARLHPEARLASSASITSTAAPLPTVKVDPAGPLVDNLRLSPDTGERIHLRHEGVGVVSEPFVRAQEDRGLLMSYVAALGGLEAALTRGSAGVSSSVSPMAGGPSQTIASGHARSKGYRFSLYKPPEKTGFFFPPSIGFLSQQIDIADFRQEIPVVLVPGATEIPANARDAATGEIVDPNAPVVYQLNLKSGYVGQSAGLNMVIGSEDAQLFSTIRAGVNLFEVRYMDVLFIDQRSKGWSVAALQSATAGAQIGLALPVINLAIRAAVEWQYFASFKYPHPVEFRSAVVYNPVKMVNERPPLDVDGAQLWTLDGQISLVYLF